MSAANDLAIDLKGLFGRFQLDAQATVPGRGLTALVGPSGSGKTTLLRCIAGLERAEGSVRRGTETWQAERRFLPPHRRGVGYVFQEASLLPHLSVRRNLAFAERRASDRPGPAFDEVVEMLGVAPLLGRGPDVLSGGERQRVAIARALLSKPVLLLMDEPLSSLDAASKAEVMPYLEALHRRLRLPVLYVSHDAVEVARLADRVLAIENGKLREVGERAPPQPCDVHDPVTLMTDSQVRALARAALAAGLQPPETGR